MNYPSELRCKEGLVRICCKAGTAPILFTGFHSPKEASRVRNFVASDSKYGIAYPLQGLLDAQGVSYVLAGRDTFPWKHGWPMTLPSTRDSVVFVSPESLPEIRTAFSKQAFGPLKDGGAIDGGRRYWAAGSADHVFHILAVQDFPQIQANSQFLPHLEFRRAGMEDTLRSFEAAYLPFPDDVDNHLREWLNERNVQYPEDLEKQGVQVGSRLKAKIEEFSPRAAISAKENKILLWSSELTDQGVNHVWVAEPRSMARSSGPDITSGVNAEAYIPFNAHSLHGAVAFLESKGLTVKPRTEGPNLVIEGGHFSFIATRNFEQILSRSVNGVAAPTDSLTVALPATATQPYTGAVL